MSTSASTPPKSVSGKVVVVVVLSLILASIIAVEVVVAATRPATTRPATVTTPTPPTTSTREPMEAIKADMNQLASDIKNVSPGSGVFGMTGGCKTLQSHVQEARARDLSVLPAAVQPIYKQALGDLRWAAEDCLSGSVDGMYKVERELDEGKALLQRASNALDNR